MSRGLAIFSGLVALSTIAAWAATGLVGGSLNVLQTSGAIGAHLILVSGALGLLASIAAAVRPDTGSQASPAPAKLAAQAPA